MSRNQLEQKIIKQIINDFTVGRTDEGLLPYTQNQIGDFIIAHHQNIQDVIDNMFSAYCNELELLENPENDWICEYLYDEIDTTEMN